MVVLTYSAGFVILEKENPMVMLASSAGSLVLKRVKPVCWSGCDGEWQWLLDEEDDELKMALAVLVRLSSFCPFFFVRLGFLSSLHCTLPLSPSFSPLVRLVIWRQRDRSHKMCP
ncbi:hypothetical protein NC653_024669 [Populus alba x Populus x berolinensis]|uniref:Uncharacterized protein n=1 Tax=Populus alba x Populus x berolinensis TaxID=444605 RepID=A0AAD6Q840_9ROSI|nr:hypothetical protein NC653_024669 [Populus alba x Populus x berolinensis]